MKITQKQKNNIAPITITIAVLVIGSLSYAAYAKQSSLWPFQNKGTSEAKTDQDGTNKEATPNSLPTEEDVKNSQNAKKDSSNTESTSGNNTLKSNVSVSLSFADIINDNLEIRAFTTGVVEGSGTCTATLSRLGHDNIVRTSSAFIDSTSSICTAIIVNTSQLTSGDWQLTVTYTSPTASGISEQIKVYIP